MLKLTYLRCPLTRQMWSTITTIPHNQFLPRKECILRRHLSTRSQHRSRSKFTVDNRGKRKNKNHSRINNKSKKLDLMFNPWRVNQFLNWLGMAFNVCSDDLETLSSFRSSLLHIEKNKGPKFLISYIKECRISIENYALGSSEKKNFKLIRCRFSGLPKILGRAAHLIKVRKKNFINITLSLLSIGRTALFKKDPDFSTITSP